MLLTGIESKQREGPANILYGTDTGSLSSVTVQSDGTTVHQWTVEEPIAAKRSPVTCKYCKHVHIFHHLFSLYIFSICSPFFIFCIAFYLLFISLFLLCFLFHFMTISLLLISIFLSWLFVFRRYESLRFDERRIWRNHRREGWWKT